MGLAAEIDKLAKPKETTPAKKPCNGCDLAKALKQLEGRPRMAAVFWVDEGGKLQMVVERYEFPVAELRTAAEQFAEQQQQEHLRCLIRDTVREELSKGQA